MADLSPAQRRALTAIRDMRPVAGNDGGWVQPYGSVPRPSVRSLESKGLIEPDRTGYFGQAGVVMYRITPAGRAALGEQARDGG